MDFRYEVVMPNEGLPFRMFIFEGKDGNYRVTKHWHQSVELFLVLEGTIGFYINSRYFSLSEQDFVIVNANEIHSIDCPDPNLTIVLQIPAEAFENYREEAPYINFGRGSEEARARLVELVTDMFQAYEEKKYGYLLRVKGEFYQLLYLLVTEFKEEKLDAEVVRRRRQLDKLSQVTAFMKSHYREDIRLEEVEFSGKYSFQYVKEGYLYNCRLDTKDAFWHSKNVTVENCTVRGEYLGWYSQNLTFINCDISGTQPLCYCKGLRLINCRMENTDLCFEKSEVNAQITTPVASIKNAYAGRITAPAVGEIIKTDRRAKAEIITNER